MSRTDPLFQHSRTGGTVDEMTVAYERDHANQARMRDLRLILLQYISDPPERTSQPTKGLLVQAASALEEDMLHIDRVWD